MNGTTPSVAINEPLPCLSSGDERPRVLQSYHNLSLGGADAAVEDKLFPRWRILAPGDLRVADAENLREELPARSHLATGGLAASRHLKEAGWCTPGAKGAASPTGAAARMTSHRWIAPTASLDRAVDRLQTAEKWTNEPHRTRPHRKPNVFRSNSIAHSPDKGCARSPPP